MGNTTLLCTSEDVFKGSWTVGQENSAVISGDCPKTFLDIEKNPHERNYVCYGRGGFKTADFTQECMMLNVCSSINSIEALGRHTIIFIGDSLVLQRSRATDCLLEQCKTTRLAVNFLWVSVFDSDEVPLLLSRLHNLTSSIEHKHHTFSVVVGTGPHWFPKYAACKGAAECTGEEVEHELYIRNLTTIVRLLETIGTDLRCTNIFWVGNTPMIPGVPRDMKYGHSRFHAKDILTQNALLHHKGITFLDAHQALLERKLADPLITADGLHWCNPGKEAVPVFIAERVLHLLAIEMMSRSSSRYAVR